jgi:opacity protein-like surface antigen
MMKKLMVVLTLLFFMSPAAIAEDMKFGIGAFGGGNIPIAQDDQATGSAYGFKARIKLFTSSFVAEPIVTFSKWGAPDPINGIDLGIDGSNINYFGLDLTYGGVPGKKGLKPFAILGAGFYKVKNDDTQYDYSRLGWTIGLGLMFGLSPNFDIDVRGKAMIAPQEKGSKKGTLITGGLTYNFGPVE